MNSSQATIEAVIKPLGMMAMFVLLIGRLAIASSSSNGTKYPLANQIRRCLWCL
jgi:hypothetical protein